MLCVHCHSKKVGRNATGTRTAPGGPVRHRASTHPRPDASGLVEGQVPEKAWSPAVASSESCPGTVDSLLAPHSQITPDVRTQHQHTPHTRTSEPGRPAYWSKWKRGGPFEIRMIDKLAKAGKGRLNYTEMGKPRLPQANQASAMWEKYSQPTRLPNSESRLWVKSP